MGFDQVGWQPRIGGGGDDDYNVPASTKLDDTIDTSISFSAILAGDTGGYSTTPTIEEINAGSDMNQVIALVRRRILNYNAAFGTTMTAPDYWLNAKKSAANYATLAATINTLRVAEGFASYTFPTLTAGSTKLLGKHLAHLRKALRISGTCTLIATTTTGYMSSRTRRELPWGTTHSPEAITLGGFTTGVVFTAGDWGRSRVLSFFRVPDWWTGAVSQSYSVWLHNAATSYSTDFDARFYADNGAAWTPASSDFDVAGTLGLTVAGAFIPVTTAGANFTGDFSSFDLTPSAGLRWSVLSVISWDDDNTQPGDSNYRYAMRVTVGGRYDSLICDLGA